MRGSSPGSHRARVSEYSTEPCTRPAIAVRKPALTPRACDVAVVADEVVARGSAGGSPGTSMPNIVTS